MEVDTKYPNKFQTIYAKDAGTTGNFEVYFKKRDDPNDRGTLIFSKRKSGKFPRDDWASFRANLASVLAE